MTIRTLIQYRYVHRDFKYLHTNQRYIQNVALLTFQPNNSNIPKLTLFLYFHSAI